MQVAKSRLGALTGAGLLTAAVMLAPQAAHASTLQQRSAHPEITQVVSPRLSLPGCSKSEGFNGDVEWGANSGDTYFIKAWGEVWDQCGTEAEVYLSYSTGSSHNPNIGGSGFDNTVGVNWSPNTSYLEEPFNITIAVCADWESKWRCGTPVPVSSS